MKKKWLFALALGMLLTLALCGTALAAEICFQCEGEIRYVPATDADNMHLMCCKEGCDWNNYRVSCGAGSGWPELRCYLFDFQMECRYCKDPYTVNSVYSVDHQFVQYVSNNNATCTANGTETAQCKWYDGVNCKETHTREAENSATGHSFTNYSSNNDATCTKDGTKTATCDNGCGQTDTIPDPNSALGGEHQWRSNPTDGHTCERCHATGQHAFEQKINKDGIYLHNCTICSGHSYCNVDQLVTTPPTCSSSASCAICGKSYYAPHSYADKKPSDQLATPATCAAPATYFVQCDNCTDVNKSMTVEGGQKKDHSFTYYISNGDATCTYDGTETASCDHNCGETDTRTDSGSRLGHSFRYYSSNGDATCTRDGTETARCAHGCGATDTQTDRGSALGHSFTSYSSNGDATCTKDGSETAACDRKCGATDTRTDSGSALGHSFTNYISNGDATCTKDGSETAACDRKCGVTDTRTDVSSALGHDYAAVVTPNTCTRDGYTTYTCTRCADTYVADETSAYSHWFNLWNPNGDGTHSATCRRSDYDYAPDIPCAAYSVTVNGEILNLCPVCGSLAGLVLEVLPAELKDVKDDVDALPDRGEDIVRGLEAPFDGVLYALSAAHEYGGTIDPFLGLVQVELPLELAEAFTLVRVDVAENPRVEVWTEIPYSYENGVLSFETDAAGLFLLLPVE